MQFTRIPYSVYESGAFQKMTPAELKVYIVLLKHYNMKDRFCFPSMKRIGEEAGMDRSNVSRIIKKLQNKALIIVEKVTSMAGNQNNKYFLPDMLLFEYDNVSKNKNTDISFLKDLVDLILYISSVVMRTTGVVIKTTGVVSSQLPVINKPTSLVSLEHPNYIINYINNYKFNFKESLNEKPKKIKNPEAKTITNEFPGKNRTKEYTKNESEVVKKALADFYTSFGQPTKKSSF